MVDEQFAEQNHGGLSEAERKKMAVGQCNYLALMILSLAAFILSQNSAYFCNFADRAVKYVNGFDMEAICADASLSTFETEICRTFLSKHAVGFYHMMATIPVNQLVCVSYTLFVPGVGWVTPEFDAAFNAAKVFAVMASIFGAFGWFSVIFASCCPVSQERIKGLSCYFTFACICQSFTFFIYASNVCDKGFIAQYFPNSEEMNNAIESVTCSLGDGAKMSITAAVLFAVCSTLAPLSIAPKPIRYSRAPTSEPTEQTDAEAPQAPEAPEAPAEQPEK